ncbi:serine/arginine repetitive matrix protein 1-like [Panicum virgatum]|uniref:serine/arginine repetitive matrix protein 1-like n=1 Tax=Panicum virgatum TaxID=38727 RepID=UPI0019D53192|nr:serine/arginine repetitive matrix protein 1-like [Panicum virgatum]
MAPPHRHTPAAPTARRRCCSLRPVPSSSDPISPARRVPRTPPQSAPTTGGRRTPARSRRRRRRVRPRGLRGHPSSPPPGTTTSPSPSPSTPPLLRPWPPRTLPPRRPRIVTPRPRPPSATLCRPRAATTPPRHRRRRSEAKCRISCWIRLAGAHLFPISAWRREAQREQEQEGHALAREGTPLGAVLRWRLTPRRAATMGSMGRSRTRLKRLSIEQAIVHHAAQYG